MGDLTIGALIVEDLSVHLQKLKELFEVRIVLSNKLPLIIKREAQIHLFLICHAKFFELLRDLCDFEKHTSNTEVSQGSALLLFMLRTEGHITRNQQLIFSEQCAAAEFFTYDSVWLFGEQEQFFQKQFAKISRYYHEMSSFLVKLTKIMDFAPTSIKEIHEYEQ